MSFFIPARVRETATSFGAEGARWLEELPARVAERERTWSLAAGQAFDTGGCVSWVAPARLADGSEAVLKISLPDRECRCEADALRCWDNAGAVRLLRASDDGFTLLLERCLPGSDLWTLDEDEGNAVGADLLRRLWREPPPGIPFDTVSDYAARWCEELPREAPGQGYPPEQITRAVELARELASTQPRIVLLHGDYHPGNVLAAEREPWLVIDPKPLAGDPAYDLAQWLANRTKAASQSPDPVAALRRQIDQMSARLGLDPWRVAAWAFVKSLGWEMGPETAGLLYAALDDIR